MKTKLRAFTLTELLIALGVVGVLLAILMPVIFNILPDQNALMAKRAYYTVQTIVSELINDEGCYPDKTQAPASDRRTGFDDGYGYPNCLKWGGSDDTVAYINSENPGKKFITLFNDKIDVNDSGVTSSDLLNTSSLSTKDGMTWEIYPYVGLLKSSLDGADSGFKDISGLFALVKLDVNGSDKPNCGQSSLTDVCESSSNSNYDQFVVAISEDGKLTVLDGWARSAIKVNKDITGNDESNSESTLLPHKTGSGGSSIKITHSSLEATAKQSILEKYNAQYGTNLTDFSKVDKDFIQAQSYSKFDSAANRTEHEVSY